MLPIFANFSAGTAVVMADTDTVTSDNILLTQVTNVAIQIVWVGTPEGNFSLEASCDDGSRDTFPPTNWTSLGITPIAAGGAPGSTIINIVNAAYKWLRVTYTNASGAGTFNVWVNTKEN